LDQDFVAASAVKTVSASAVKASEGQTAEAESSVKVVVPTLNPNKTDNASDAKEQVLPKTGIYMSTLRLLMMLMGTSRP